MRAKTKIFTQIDKHGGIMSPWATETETYINHFYLIWSKKRKKEIWFKKGSETLRLRRKIWNEGFDRVWKTHQEEKMREEMQWNESCDLWPIKTPLREKKMRVGKKICEFSCFIQRQVLRSKPKSELLGGSARGQRGKRERKSKCERNRYFPSLCCVRER